MSARFINYIEVERPAEAPMNNRYESLIPTAGTGTQSRILREALMRNIAQWEKPRRIDTHFQDERKRIVNSWATGKSAHKLIPYQLHGTFRGNTD
jgi:hypothetical protein